MSETPETSEIVDSLKEYVERQKNLLEEDRDKLLKEGRQKFQEVVEEKQHVFARSLEELAAENSRRKALTQTPRLRYFFLRIRKLLRRVWFKEKPVQLDLFAKMDRERSDEKEAHTS